MRPWRNVAVIILFSVSCLGNYKPEPLPDIAIGEQYHLNGDPGGESAAQIVSILDTLVRSVVSRDLSVLPSFVDREKGIYLDIKGLWTYNELVNELQQDNSYFTRFFFENSLANGRKSVRDILLSSGGLRLDLYFEDIDTCEVKIRFEKNRSLANDLNNPYFIRIKGKWYIYRMF